MVDTEIELGYKVQDSISGFTGIVSTIGDHLTGCTRIGVQPSGEEQTAVRGDEEFFYEAQLEVLEDETEFTSDDHITTADFSLGQRVRDDVTDFEGVISVINYKLWNCPQVAVRSEVRPGVSETGEAEWFDAPRLTNVSGQEFTETYKDLQESEETAATGSSMDKGPSMDSP